MLETWTQTYTGKRFDVLNPKPEDVCIEDIARALSGICRFKGSTVRHYSVAEHSLYVCDVVRKVTNDPLILWYALMHDAAEAYIGDFPAPWKRLVMIGDAGIARIEGAIDSAIRQSLLGYDYAISTEGAQMVTRADMALVYQEKLCALPIAGLSWGTRFDNFELRENERVGIAFLDRDAAYTQFMCAFKSLLHTIRG